MAIQVGINGFGRIGRITFRAILREYANDIEIVAVNDLVDPETNAHLLRHDTNYGAYPGQVTVGEGGFTVDGKQVRVFAEKDPAKIPWGDLGVDIVIESTGVFTDATKAAAHLQGGAKKVIITAPAKNEDITVALGVNQDKYDAGKHNIVSNASCTTNCLAPMAKVLLDTFGINRGFMTTVHAATNDQRVADQAHSDLRRARATLGSIIPTSTGAAKAISLVIPELKGKMHGMAMRVPTTTVSVVDLTAELGRAATVEEINASFTAAAAGPLKGILAVTNEELVSVDFKGNPHSSIVDLPSTLVLDGNFVKVLSWYDNEWGYSCRVADLCKFIFDRGL
jgi:glyceraldehyde 3-phosphate dehydrogenase